ncbi:hypothetical protein SAY87_008555 [Trapa incisa]|uniref:Phytocyanin domain-containing protein n=1 Tax=Trapa incisa TaxID=236973 RepID=A0AAN7JUM2_9MYRT|nr:hypothetical protein SAY87_008555 [Trapa incisa]
MEDPPLLQRCYFSSFLLVLVIQGLLVNGARSEVYTVGDSEGWDTGIDYGVWSHNYNFSTGDILIFKYVKSQHNVYEVTESTYRSCNSSSGVLDAYDTGSDRVTLKEARKHWFICDVGGHCLGGMRFGIDVSRGSTNGSPHGGAPSLQAQPPPSTPDGPDTNNNGSSKLKSAGPRGWTLLFCIVAWVRLVDLFPK